MQTNSKNLKDVNWQQAYYEMRAAWFTTLGILLLRSEGLTTTVTREEGEKAQRLRITKKDNENGDATFSGEYVEEGSPQC